MAIDWTKSKEWKKGNLVEGGRFLRLLSLIDKNPKPAVGKEQYVDHIDWHTCIGSVDVKSMKKVSRSDGATQDELCWVEFRARNGGDGWVFGNQKWVAFEREFGFMFVLTEHLRDLANDLCDFNNVVSSAKDALYSNFKRDDCVLTLIKFKDIESRIPHFTIRDESSPKEEPIKDEDVFL